MPMDILAEPMGYLSGSLLVTATVTPGVLIIGDSIAVGEAPTVTADVAYNVTATQSIVYDAHFSQTSADPPPFQTLTGNLRPYTIGSSAGMGVELAIGQEFTKAGVTPVILKDAVAGTTAAQWLPGSTTYPAGVGLFGPMVTRAHANETLYGCQVKYIFVILGTNDAADSTAASAFQTNVGLINAGLRSAFPGAVICWAKVNAATDPTRLFVSTVRTGLAAARAADPTWDIIDIDDCSLLSDLLHWPGDTCMVGGQRGAYALLDRNGIARVRPATAPVLVGFGPQSRGPSGETPQSWGGAMDGDLELLVVEQSTGGTAAALTTPAGWTLVDAQTSTGGGVQTKGAVYKRALTAGTLAANNGHTPPTSVSTNNAVTGSRIYTYRGPNLNPTVGAVQGSVNDAFGTSITLAGITTTHANALIAMPIGGYRSDNSTNTITVTAGGLTGVISDEQCARANVNLSDSTTTSHTSGTKAVAGATGSATGTSLLNTVMTGWQIEIDP